MSDENKLIEEFRERDQRSCDQFREFLKEAKTDYAFYANNQWDEPDRKILERDRRPFVTFNQSSKVIDTVVGSEITNRYDIKYLARTPSDLRDSVSRIISETVRYIRERTKAGHHESRAFWDMVVCGLGCIEIYQDYEVDPDGLPVIKRISPFYMRPDPDARETNLRDKRFVIRRAWVSKEDMKLLWPEGYEKLMEKVDATSFDNFKFKIQRLAGYSAKDAGFYNRKKDEFLVHDYQRCLRKYWWRIQNPVTGELLEAFSEKDKDNMIDRIREIALVQGYPITDYFEDNFVSKLPRREYERSYICGDEILSTAVIPTGDFTYHFISGYEDHREETTSWYGLMRPMRDPQKYVNKFYSQMVYIMATNPKGGYWYEDGAFENEEEAKRLLAQPNSLIKLLPGGKDKIEERESLGFPSGLEVLMDHAANAIPNVSGVNYFLQGLQQGSEPGVVVQAYQKQGMVILSLLFDSLSQYREEIGQAYLAFIREFLPDETIIRVNDEMGGDQIIQYSKDASTHKFDIIVTQSASSPNQQQEFWTMMTNTNLFGQMMEMGFPIPPSIVNYFPIPDQFKKDWLQLIAQQQQAQQQAEQQDQALLDQAAQSGKQTIQWRGNLN